MIELYKRGKINLRINEIKFNWWFSSPPILRQINMFYSFTEFPGLVRGIVIIQFTELNIFEYLPYRVSPPLSNNKKTPKIFVLIYSLSFDLIERPGCTQL